MWVLKQPLPRAHAVLIAGAAPAEMAPTWLYSLFFFSFTSGAQSIAGFKELPALRQRAIISGSMIIASTANCTKYLPNDEDCREAGKITFFIMS